MRVSGQQRCLRVEPPLAPNECAGLPQQRRTPKRDRRPVLGKQARRDGHSVSTWLRGEALRAVRPAEREVEALQAPGLRVVRRARAQAGLQPRHEQRPPGKG